MFSITRLPKNKFRLDFRLFGYRFRKVFGSEAEAIEFKSLVESKFKAEIHTVADAIEKYLEQISSRKKRKSRDVDKNALNGLKTIVGGGRYIHEVKPYDLELYRTSELKRELKASTVNRKFNTIKHFFKICETWEYIQNSPARNISSFGEIKTQRNVWDKNHVDQLLSNIHNKRDKLIVEILSITGARLSSVLSLTWTDVDFKNRKIWFVTRKGPKSIERKYFFPLTDALMQIFQQTYQHNKPSDFVFLTKNRKKVNAEHFSRKISKLLKKHFPEHNLTLHGLRHSFATSLSRKGVPLKDIMSLLGHSSVKVTEGYIGTNEEDLFKIVS